jgi:hypothetical protein
LLAFVLPSPNLSLGLVEAPLKLVIVRAAFATVLSGAPLITFLNVGWFARYYEFQNSLKGEAISA